MLRFLHQLSAWTFYLLGSSFFTAYVLLRNEVMEGWAAWWMQVADLPFVLTALLYGGLSVYLSLTTDRKPSAALAWGIGIPVGIFFLAIAAFNFWGLFTS